ncbi:hypothetical protein CASFOL_021957 [Castilleja foliolosa]|uniref:Uncharacterized protein n=1 Tax=Castilleja foliolosa TaxID=1961234 RepID=A0ABD3CY27_9LAMI
MAGKSHYSSRVNNLALFALLMLVVGVQLVTVVGAVIDMKTMLGPNRKLLQTCSATQCATFYDCIHLQVCNGCNPATLRCQPMF